MMYTLSTYICMVSHTPQQLGRLGLQVAQSKILWVQNQGVSEPFFRHLEVV